jgi:outer membrane protein OmpA-like peptidoglycan-associated protein
MKLKSHLLGMLFLLITVTTVFGQQGHNISYKVLSSDYQYLIDRNNDRYNDENGIVSGVEIGYFKSLTNSFDLGIPFRHGRVLYPLSDTDVNQYKAQSFTSLGLNGRLRIDNGKILPLDVFLSPFFLAGIEGNYYGRQDAIELNFPVGAGLNFRLAEGFNIQAQSEYHFGSTNFLVHSVGLFFELGRAANPTQPKAPKVEVVEVPMVKKPVVVAPTDTDGDGIEDSKDACPKVAGIAKFNGCADTDGDGFEDSKDACPSVAGKLNGCPDTDGDGVVDSKDGCPSVAGKLNGCPDTDGDGIANSKDNCPTIAGLAKFNGCPDTDGDGVQNSKDACPTIAGTLNGCPDKDRDGIADNKDKCPSTAGVAENNGCPLVKEETKKVLEFAKQGVEFNTGKNAIKASSYAIMDNIAKIMKENPSYNLRISGYTDSQGREDRNLALSQRRAKACHDYLVKKGISSSRMNHNGFGEANPIATNDTAAGRGKNRRVEFDIYFSGQ